MFLFKLSIPNQVSLLNVERKLNDILMTLQKREARETKAIWKREFVCN